MNVLDLLLLAAFVVAGIRGWRQGALSQVLAFGGAALGLVLGSIAAPHIASAFVDEPGTSLSLVTLGLLLGMILLGQGLGFAIGLRLRAHVHAAGAGALDRTAGIAVGFASIAITVWLLGTVLAQGPAPAVVRQIRGSAVVALIDAVLPPPPDVFGRVGTFLDQQGFPQVFAGMGGGTAPPVDPPPEGVVAQAAAAGQAATVQVQALGCGGVSSGTGVVVAPGYVVTNAHVVAGSEVVSVRDAQGQRDAVTIAFDPVLDLAVVSSPQTTATPLPWTATPVGREAAGATLGYPGGQRELVVRPAAVRSRTEALGRDIYGRGLSRRQILVLSAAVEPGDSGGPFVLGDGSIGGIVFAAAAGQPDVGYALTAERVRPDVDAAIARNSAVPTGDCRF